MRKDQGGKKNITKNGIGLHDVMLLIGLQRRTGELVLESGNNIGSLVFHEGRLLLAFSPYTRAIGDLLVERGVLTDAELLDVLKQQRIGPHAPVGMLLLKTGKVTFQDIEMMVQDQIRKAVKDFSSWNPVDLSFVDKDVQPVDSINLPVHEFLADNIREAVLNFVSGMPSAVGPISR
jgi:glutaredoxin-related protein